MPFSFPRLPALARALNGRSGILPDGQKAETTAMSFKGQVGEWNVVDPHDRVLLAMKYEQMRPRGRTWKALC